MPHLFVMRYFCDNARHLVCLPYSIDNLHEMAKELEIKRCWFHKDHYDIPKRRVNEITAKCEVVASKKIIKIINGSKMLLQDLQVKLNNARKTGDKVALSLLQVVLGDLATVKARSNKEPTEEQIDNLIRSIRDRNAETLALIAGKNRESDVARLQTENVYLTALLPTTLTVEEIKVALAEMKEQLLSAKSDGQAVGVAMKFLKPKGLKVLGDDVKKAVEILRN